MSAAPPGALVRLGALGAAYFATIGLIHPYAPLWFESLGFSTVLIGAISALQSGTRLVSPYAWSWWADHGGARVRLMRLAALGALLATVGLLVVQGGAGPWPLVLLMALLFLANGGIAPLADAALTQLLARADGFDAKRYGRVRVWGSIGFIAAVLGFGELLQRLGIALFPWSLVLLHVVLLAVALALPALADEHAAGAEPPPAIGPLLRRPVALWFFASVALTVLAHTALYAFFSLYAAQLGHGKAAIGALWAVGVVVEVLFFWKQGPWFERWPATTWLQVAALATALRFGATAALGAVDAVLWVAQALHAITFAAHHTACIALVSRLFPGRARGRGQALYTSLGYGVPGVAGGLAGGWLAGQFGYAALFWAAAGCGLLAWWAARRTARALAID